MRANAHYVYWISSPYPKCKIIGCPRQPYKGVAIIFLGHTLVKTSLWDPCYSVFDQTPPDNSGSLRQRSLHWISSPYPKSKIIGCHRQPYKGVAIIFLGHTLVNASLWDPCYSVFDQKPPNNFGSLRQRTLHWISSPYLKSKVIGCHRQPYKGVVIIFLGHTMVKTSLWDPCYSVFDQKPHDNSESLRQRTLHWISSPYPNALSM